MSCDVPGQRLGDTTFFAQSFERIHTTFVVGYWKHPAVFTQSTVFFHNLLGIIKQLDVGFRSGLLSMDNDPFTFIEKFLDVLFLQVVQINESETCETTEQEQVTHHAHLLSCDRCLHQQMNLFFAQKFSCGLFFLVLISSRLNGSFTSHSLSMARNTIARRLRTNTIAEFIFKCLSVLRKVS